MTPSPVVHFGHQGSAVWCQPSLPSGAALQASVFYSDRHCTSSGLASHEPPHHPSLHSLSAALQPGVPKLPQCPLPSLVGVAGLGSLAQGAHHFLPGQGRLSIVIGCVSKGCIAFLFHLL